MIQPSAARITMAIRSADPTRFQDVTRREGTGLRALSQKTEQVSTLARCFWLIS